MTDPGQDPTSFYPVSLDVTGRACLVVGGGPVAARKARALLECGALVTVIAPSLAQEMEVLTDRLEAVERRPYASGDAARFRLVVTATGRPDVDGSVHDDAEAAGVWVNSADDRAHSSFILPAVHRDGSVTVAVSTGGLSPAFSSWLRDRLAAQCGENAGALAALIGEARERLRRAGRPSDSVDWAALLDGPLLDFVRAGDWDNALAIVAAALAQ
jgi:siroheme synthase-like protein